GADFDFTGGELDVLAALAFFVDAAFGDFAGDADDPLAAQPPRLVARRHAALVGVEDDLREAVAVAQVDQHHAAVVAIVVNPAGEFHFFAEVGDAQLPARVGAVTGFDSFSHGLSSQI